MPRHTLTIGTRGSALALAQTELVRAALVAHHPGLEVATVRITTRGDVMLDRPLSAIGDKGLFVGEIEEAMRAGRVDIAVHSAKDLPSELPPDMAIAAFPPRADPRDALVSRYGEVAALPSGARVGTSSQRRSAQIRAMRPDLTLLDVRGNVDTRLRKLGAGEYDALLLACAGLDRLGLIDERVVRLSPDVMLPAVGQGALAIELCTADPGVAELVAPLDDPSTSLAVRAERAFLGAVGGGCSTAVAAHAVVRGDDIRITGFIGAVDGRAVRGKRSGRATEGGVLARSLAEELLAGGGAALLAGDAAAMVPDAG